MQTPFDDYLISEATGVTCPHRIQVAPVFLQSSPKIYEGVILISKSELTDNFTFASALQMLKQLVEQGLLTADEGTLTRRELERRLRPTLFLP